MDNRFEGTVGAGTMMAASGTAARFPHRWTPGGVTVEADFTGGHLLHLAAAGCVLNDLYRQAAALGIELKGVRVIAAAGSTPRPGGPRASAIRSIPQAMRAGVTVRRVGLADPCSHTDARFAACLSRGLRWFAGFRHAG